jgi:endoglucanase
MTNLFAGRRLHVDPDSQARRVADALRPTAPEKAALIEKIARQPQAFWLLGDVATAQRVVAQCQQQGTMPVFVDYWIPKRDSGGHSAGGAPDAATYKAWTEKLARAIAPVASAVILEPDALAQLQDLPEPARAERLGLLAHAVERLKRNAATAVYVDAGHPAWHPPGTMAARLKAAGIAGADGFALNVSNFRAIKDCTRYGSQLSQLVGGKPFVIDTSRNGAGPFGAEWCNPPGRKLGLAPTGFGDTELLHAVLWIKRPGESDGSCNGGPPAGKFWSEYALGLIG